MPFTGVVDYTPSGGPIAASAAPGSIGNGFTDVTGNFWSIDSSNVLHSVANTTGVPVAGVLARLGTSDQAVNSQTIMRFTAISGETYNIIHRLFYTNGNPNGYLAIYNGTNGGFVVYRLVNGVQTQILAATNVVLTPGTDYDFILTTYQETQNATSIYAHINTTGGTVAIILLADDATASLQNVPGGQGIYATSDSSGATPIAVKRIRTFAAPIFTPFVSYVPAGGPIAASANPGSVGNGFVDQTGNVWSINSTNVLQSIANTNASPWNVGVLSRTSSGDIMADGKISTKFTNGLGETVALFCRYATSGGNSTGYLATFTQSTNVLAFYGVINGTRGSLLNSTTGNLTTASDYTFTFNVFQADAANTLLGAQINDKNGVQVLALSSYDNTAGLQNITGGQAVYGSAVANAVPLSVKSITTYNTTASATGFSVNLGSAASTSIALPGTISLIGGSTLTGTLVVTLTDGAGGTFSPSTVSVTANNAPAPFTYTPSSAGVKTVSWTHTGGNTGMTGDGSQAVTVSTATNLNTNDPACVSSPYNKQVGTGGAGTEQTWEPGAYWRFYIKGCTTANILLDGSKTGATWRYSIDGGQLSPVLNVAASTAIALPNNGSHVVTVVVETTLGPNRWNNGNYFGMQGLQLGVGGSPDTASVVRGTKNILIFGDSITEGTFANQGVDSVTNDYSYYLGECLRLQGYEYGICACSGQGYTVGGAGIGNVPPFFTIGNDSQSTWNKVSSTTSRLNGQGQFVPQPDIIFDAFGTNDAIETDPPANLQATINALYRAFRAAAPNALLVSQIPFAGFNRSVKNAATAALSDSKLITLDLQIDDRMGAAANQYCNLPVGSGGIHPNTWGHANIGTLVVDKLLTATGAGASGSKYPVGLPISHFVSGSTVTSVPWAIPASGIPGATGSAQSGNTTFTSSSAPSASTELCNLLDRMVSDGRAVIS